MNPLFSPPRADPFADVPHSPAEHFRLALFGVIAHVIEQCGGGDPAAAVQAHPFLADYRDEIEARVGSDDAAARWRAAMEGWEARARGHLPLRALLGAGMSRVQVEVLLAVGMVEEDPRFGQLFEQAQGSERRPTLGLLLAWWRADDDGADRADGVRRALLALVESGLLSVLTPDAPRPSWTLAVPHPVWDALRGDAPSLRWLAHVPHDALPAMDDYVAPADTEALCAALPGLLAAHPGQVVVVRGPARNGRRTLLGCVARALGRSLLVADAGVFEDEARWRQFGALAALLGALPVLHAELAPGETRTLPPLPFSDAPLGVVTTRHGAWASDDSRPLLTLDLPLPDLDQRVRHWRAAAPGQPAATLHALAAAVRLTSGNIRRAALAAEGFAALEGRTRIEPDDLRQACRGLQSARLETLAARLPTAGTLADLAVDTETREELDALAARCRFRERLAAGGAAVAQGNAGVRALLAGGSGTGKTLAARLLAASLGKDLYRVDLAATVNKYIGETEKNLDQAFAAAEELDLVLLLDEGDALMANRTDVGTSNDRYANLETNFLLQRIESFDGILLVTSNAADRIDKAFRRRMDVVIHFRAPDEWRRYEILRLHLGDAPEVDDQWLQDAACRCALAGGQWRNVVAHARLLALQESRPIGAGHLHAALLREYRKTGAQCPLRPARAVPVVAVMAGLG
ncbi:MAG TPA: ATP-binding protein [Longimicrobium sp.]|nr:ATP-binding protein [Longimicrobium sp.]